MNWGLVLNAVSALATLGAVIVAFAANRQSKIATASAIQLSRDSSDLTARVAQAQILLQIDERLADFSSVNAMFREETVELLLAVGPDGRDSWSRVDQYMGVFERIQSFVDLGLLDIKHVWDFYGYRYVNIVKSDLVHQKSLTGQAASWYRFIDLGERLQKYVETSVPEPKRIPQNEPGFYLKYIIASELKVDDDPAP